MDPRRKPDPFWLRAAGHSDIYELELGGSSEPRLIYQDQTQKYPSSISPDGHYLAYRRATEGGYDIWVLSLSDPENLQPILASPYNEGGPAFSPDGKWLAYDSDESGRKQVYVVAFPEGGVRRKVSTGGGLSPMWSADGRALYYDEGTKVMRVDVLGNDQFSSPRVLFDDAVGNWKLMPDGKGIIIEGQGSPGKLRLTLNWRRVLEQTVPGL